MLTSELLMQVNSFDSDIYNCSFYILLYFRPVDDAAVLTETILDESPVQYSVVRKLLVSSNGYSYGIKVNQLKH